MEHNLEYPCKLSLPPLLVARLVVSRDCSRFRGGALARIFFRVHLRSGYRMLAIAIAVFCGKTGRTGHALNITGPHWPRGPKRGGADEVAVTRGLTRDPSFAVSDTDKNVLRNTNSFRMHERARNFLEMRIYRRLS